MSRGWPWVPGPTAWTRSELSFAGRGSTCNDDGLLVVEVGNTERALIRAFPHLPFVWPDFAMGGGGVFVLRAADLASGG